MDKNAIKKYAVWARRELIERVSQRAMIYGITAKDAGDPNAESVNGHLLSQAEKRQRQALIRKIKTKGYEQVMEEVAYTWFNRFAALRFMEVNGYLPSHIRVFTNDAGEFKPQILAEVIHLELDGLDMNRVYELENANKSEELFKYLLIVQCNALNCILPGMFQRIEDYTELLLPDYLLREGSVIEQMVTSIPEEDWTDQVQIIGWLYQYYNTEPKDKVFANLKKNIKITKENIPAATQLFTPDWIVHYMVENSLGRLWLEGHPNDALKSEWKYYLDEAEQDPEIRAQLVEIQKEYAALKPEDIIVIDPCQGSGHILAYMFDVLVQIYEAYGYSAREAAPSIVEHNIWGLDIDERSAQMAYFSVMMKARQYDRRFFSCGIQPHVYAIQESNNLDPNCIEYFVDGRKELKSAMDTLVKELHDAKEFGSILNVSQVDFDALYARVNEIRNKMEPSIYSYQVVTTLLPFVQVAQTLAQKYHSVVTNPPYMGSSNMDSILSNYVKAHYPTSKADLFAVFIERCYSFLQRNGLQGMITMQSWLFLSTYEKLRYNIINKQTIISVLHLGIKAFEEIGNDVVQTVAFIMRKSFVNNYKGSYFRLLTHDRQLKEKQYLNNENRFVIQQRKFEMIPGELIAYWVTDQMIRLFIPENNLTKYGCQKTRVCTGNNDRFLRLWFEVSKQKMYYPNKWVPYPKGGLFRKWYGNNDYVINYDNDGYDLYHFKGAMPGDKSFHLKQGITWSALATGKASFRYVREGCICDQKGPLLYIYDEDNINYILGVLNSKVAEHVLQMVAPTVDYIWGSISKIPVVMEQAIKGKINSLVKENITICKQDWDAFETSMDFIRHPMLPENNDNQSKSIESIYQLWVKQCEYRFQIVKQNEEEINRLLIKAYNLQNEMDPYETDQDISIHFADPQREIKSLISFAVGCILGRYSLSKPGLIFAGDNWDDRNYPDYYKPDQDGIIPITDDEYFDDDIVGKFIDFIKITFGEDNLENNLLYIAKQLGGNGSCRDIIRNYFINDFYIDHCAQYSVFLGGKRPIYWLFDSGKKNGFKCLIYMHRYQPDTIARIRTDYVHEQQSRYRTAIADLEQRISGASTSERVKLSKQLAKLQAQAEEIRVYEEKIHHLADQMIKIDLDDGVKHNYEIFKDVLAKIK